MEIKPTGHNSIPVVKLGARSEAAGPSASAAEVPAGDEVAFGKLGSTLFQNGKALSFRDAQALAGTSPRKPLEEKSTLSGFDLNSTMALGGPDSPCFYKGQVMTTREAQELAAKDKTEG